MSGPLVTFAVGNRPHYFEQTLASWRQVDGIGDARLLFNCEPTSERSIAMARAVDWAETEVVVNNGTYGGPANQFFANWRANDRGESWWVLSEEDVVVAPDILDMFRWMARTYRDSKGIVWMNADTHSASNGPQPPKPRGVFKGNPKTLVWGTWADRWPFLDRHWDVDWRHPSPEEKIALGLPDTTGGGFDWRWYGHCVPKHHALAIKPCLSRVKHIGETGRHSTPSIYKRTVTDCFVAERDVDLSGEWYEADPTFTEKWD